MISASVSVDDPNLAEGVRFCSDPFGHGFRLIERRPQK
jgi:hypothetical protein